MKLKNIISLAIIALGAMVTSCSQDGYWTPFNYEESAVAFSFEGPEYAYSYASADLPEYVSVKVHRANNQGTVIVPMVFESGSKFLSADSTVTFAEGAYEAEYKVKLLSGINAGNHSFTVTMADSTKLAVTGRAKISGKITVEYSWEDWATGDLIDNWMGVTNEDVNIMKAVGSPVYRIMKPFYNASFSAWWEQEVPESYMAGKTAEYIEFEVVEGGLIEYDKFMYADYNAASDQYVYGFYPTVLNQLKYVEDDLSSYNAYQKLISETQVQFAPYMYVPGLGGWGLKQFVLDITDSGKTF